MTHLIVSRGLLLICCGYALLRGGAPERIIAAAYLVSVPATVYALGPLIGRFRGFELGAFLIDFALFIIFVAIALRADRYWTLWVSAMQASSLLGYFLGLLGTSKLNLASAILVQMWFYPIMVTLGIATFRHRLRKRRYGIDSSWFDFSRLSIRPPMSVPIG
ncbi:MAG: hypothetical protein JOY99_16425 [Sphingomonadaceae bacterium]|nr:hypothetical protein [Sphingomonadaceae bacterium]